MRIGYRIVVSLVFASTLAACDEVARDPVSLDPSGDLAPSLGPSAQAGEFRAGLQLLASDLVHPLMLTEAPDGTGRLFVVDQIGVVRVIASDGTIASQPWLDARDRMITLRTGYDERGLLALAFHPQFASNGRLFVHYSAPPRLSGYDNTKVVAEYRVTPGNPSSVPRFHGEIVSANQPQSNHAGGTIAFGPDRYLYIAWGDGGSQNDVGFGHVEDWYDFNEGGNGQGIQNLLGSVLRIDVDRGTPYAIPDDNPFRGRGCDDGCDEIWAYGFRNPFQLSFDMGGSRSLIISDVGEKLWEEINLGVRGGNYGWNVREGTDCFVAANPLTVRSSCPTVDPTTGQALRGPALQIPTLANPSYSTGSLAVIGGHVYRGNRVSALRGYYVFGSYSNGGGSTGAVYVSGRHPDANGLWSYQKVRITTSANGELNEFVLGIGQDRAGEVYVLTSDRGGLSGARGKVFRLIPEQANLSDLRTGTGRPYVAVPGGMTPGARVYIDRDFTYQSVPAHLHGQNYIQTANEDMTVSGIYRLITFQVDRESDVYVAYNSRAHFPGWLKTSFVNTGQMLVVNAGGQLRTFTLWRRTYQPSEQVILSSSRPGDLSAHMYTVIVAPVQVTGLRIGTGRPYELVPGGMTAGARPYIDREFTYQSVPPVLEGQTYIRTATDDMTVSGIYRKITFRVNQRSDVYVAYNSRAHFPGWLKASFVNTGQTLVVNADGQLRTFTLWRRTYQPSEEVILSSTRPGDTTAYMYTVFVAPAGAAP